MAVSAALVVLIIAINPVPPIELTMSTGGSNDITTVFAQEYQDLLAEEGFTLNILEGVGSALTVERLISGEAQVGIVSTGIVEPEQAEVLNTLGSLYFEPIWVFYQADQEVRYMSDLLGKRIGVGAVGSGTRLTALRLLEANGITRDNSDIVESSFGDLRAGLESGELDAGFYVTSPDNEAVASFLRSDTVALLDVQRPDAYRSLYPYLTTVTVGQGLVDLQNNIPPEPITVLAGAANLVVRSDVHPNLVRLLSRTIAEVHSSAGMFEDTGQFPSAAFTDLTIHPEARRYLAEGDTFFEASFPFVFASILDRFIIVLIPLIPLLYPLIRGLPPVYNMVINRRITRWYGILYEIDQKADQLPADQIDVELKRLEDIMDALSKSPRPPLGRMGDFYNLQLHIDLVSKRLETRRQTLAAAPA
ncbi:MAG: TAXI family TRAP transporter solute-binding subunit [Chloroflexi bacterium]|nr:TAXI family TRAP transporter solute-binding subunit [Chloroflexota bacterium]